MGKEEVEDEKKEEKRPSVEEEEVEQKKQEESSSSSSSSFVIDMKPWEQHSAVISIPRFNYKAPSSLLLHSLSAFLITSPIKREKSATKEALAIFEKIIRSYHECSDAKVADKKRKVCEEEPDGDYSVSESKSPANSELSDEKHHVPASKSGTDFSGSYTLSPVKLTRSGLLLFTVPSNEFPDVVEVVSDIFRSLELGILKSPLWCHRIFPIQATCCLNEKELQTAVSKLVLRFVNDNGNKLQRPIKFAIGYNRRGIEQTEMKISRSSSNDVEKLALLDRDKCFSVVATAVTDVVSDSVVDLKCPELSVLVEVLPLSGITNGSLVVGVAVLPCNLVSTKPRLCVKSLFSDTILKSKQ